MHMTFNMRMYDSESRIVVVHSRGYESILKHSHEFIEIIYVESGAGLQVTDDNQIEIHEGDILLMTGEESHSIRPLCEEKDFTLLNVIFERDVVDMDLSMFKCDKSVSLKDHPEIVSLIYSLDSEYRERKEYFEYVSVGYLYQLLGNLARKFDDRVISTKNFTIVNNSEYVRKAVEFIQDNYAEKIRLDDVASHVALSSGYLQKIFHKERNTSVIEYLLRYRIEQACKLLIESDCSVMQISNTVGFSDVKNFYVAFKKVVNMTPNRYREYHRAEKKEGTLDGKSSAK